MYDLQVEQEGNDHHIQKRKNMYSFLVKVCTLGEGGYEVNIKVIYNIKCVLIVGGTGGERSP